MKLFCYSVLMRRDEPGMVTRRMANGWCRADSEEAARGHAVKVNMDDNPSFAISEVIVMEIPQEARDASGS